MSRLRFMAATALGCFIYVTPAASAPATARATSAPAAGVREHDGLYFHVGTGLSALNGRVRSDILDGRLHGISTSSDLALGGTITRGVVLGGGLYTASVLVSTFEPDEEYDEDALPREVDPTGTSLSIIGPLVTYYPDSRDGLHFDIAAGVATLTGFSYDVGRFGDNDVAVGGGFVLGLGYELWIGEQWSLGVATRLMTALVTEQDNRGIDWLLGVGTFPNVLLGATYH